MIIISRVVKLPGDGYGAMIHFMPLAGHKTPHMPYHYASPSSGDAYRNRQLTPNFKLKFLCVDMFPCEDSKIVSVCPSIFPSVHLSVPREKKSPYLRQYQSYISN